MPSDAGALSSGTCDLIGEINRVAFRECIPLNVTCEITLACNVRCVHCYNFDRDAPPPPADELTPGEWKRVLAELRAAGALFVSFSGGEPLVHPAFFDLMDEAARLHFAVQVLTNGTALNAENARRIGAYRNLMAVGIALFGATDAAHEAVTRTPGSFRRAVDGAKLLRDAGAAVTLKFTVMRGNAREAGDMIRLAEGLGLPYLVDPTVTCRYDGARDSLAGRADPEELEALYRGPLRGLLRVRPSEPGDDEWMCNCARGNCAITATGDVYPCIAAPWKAGSVRERPFAEIWRSSPVFERIRGL
ncbi:MAG: radical SAM/SPASM domain-containing protein, partial [Planctomycetota bacterium]